MDLKKMSIPEKFSLITKLQNRLNEGQFILTYLKVKKQYQIGFINGGNGKGYGYKIINKDIVKCLDASIGHLIEAYKKDYNEDFETTYSLSKLLEERDKEIEFLKNKIIELETGKKKRGRPKGTRIIKGFLGGQEKDYFEGDIKSLIDYLRGEKKVIHVSDQTSKFTEEEIEKEILRANPQISGVPHLFFIYNNDKKEFLNLRAKAYRRLWNKHNKNNK